jgi:FdhD protein
MMAVRVHPVVSVIHGQRADGRRSLPEEVAVAISYNGTTQAVMMATPADLEDFARGFTLTEGIADPAGIDSIAAVGTPKGIDLQIWLKPEAAARLAARRRTMAGPVGCGLCGIDSLDEAMRPAATVGAGVRLTAAQVGGAMGELRAHQPLHDVARALHAAAFWQPAQGVVLAREDIGRHNAVDKLAGAMAAGRQEAGQGVILLTSRLSVDLVQKVAATGASVVVAVSAPTGGALALADACGMTVVAMARPDRFEIYTHPHRIEAKDPADVA